MKSYGKLAAGLVAVVALAVAGMLTWKSEPVQRAAVPERYWSAKVVVAEIRLERVREKASECVSSAKRLPGLERLCRNYNDELERTVNDVVAARAALRQALR